ncbi:membrane protein S24 [Saimiriine betaherpesvirus 4]|uniref:Membrane protein S24 n=1 Tax=Saimiriine betaherpesvirus 4 TaxID=1535247 RepID=G8XT50_9BETA|nr:membrane protein S24 [Saimiriine betaherpesvirus 4]AEV80999.1 membrane protein S24 [Saimiriine betaherpesvirus 4]
MRRRDTSAAATGSALCGNILCGDRLRCRKCRYRSEELSTPNQHRHQLCEIYTLALLELGINVLTGFVIDVSGFHHYVQTYNNHFLFLGTFLTMAAYLSIAVYDPVYPWSTKMRLTFFSIGMSSSLICMSKVYTSYALRIIMIDYVHAFLIYWSTIWIVNIKKLHQKLMLKIILTLAVGNVIFLVVCLTWKPMLYAFHVIAIAFIYVATVNEMLLQWSQRMPCSQMLHAANSYILFVVLSGLVHSLRYYSSLSWLFLQ